WDAPLDECYYQKALHRLRPTRGYDVRLMVAFLRLWSERGDLSKYVTQTSIAHLPRERLLQIPLPVPPRVEQETIAKALDAATRVIDCLDRLLAKKRAIKQAVLRRMLTGDSRLPGFSTEWDTRKLGDLGTWKGGMTPSMSNERYWSPATVPW